MSAIVPTGTFDAAAQARKFTAKLDDLVDDLIFSDHYLTDHQYIQVEQRLREALQILRGAQE